MPKRSYSAAGSYRYGFNGKENDNDVKGLGNQQDYGMRIYDARLGRFLSVDPLSSSFPWYTPYQFAGNSPLANIDLDGLEPVPSVSPDQKEGDKTITTSEVSTPGGQPGCADCTTKTEVKVWYFHAGGLRKDNNNPVTGAASYTQAGWYSSEEYAQVLSTSRAATSLALRLHLYNSITEKYAKLRDGIEDLSNLIGSGVSLNTEKHLLAAAYKKAGDANFGVTGKVELSSFNVEDIFGITLLLRHGLKAFLRTSTNEISDGFNSMKEFTDAFGTAPKGMNWHHFVEQRLAKNGSINPKLIYNIENSVLIQSGKNSPHTAISAFYSSKKRFTNGLTVREWIGKKSFEEQMKFGKDIYNRVMNAQPLPQ